MAIEWHYAKNGTQHGPVAAESLQDLLRRGELKADDLVWHDELPEWTPAEDVPGLMPARKPAPSLAHSRRWTTKRQPSRHGRNSPAGQGRQHWSHGQPAQG
jgi:hypothetical protein